MCNKPIEPLVRSALPGWIGLTTLFGTLYLVRQQHLVPVQQSCILVGSLFLAMFLSEAWLCLKNNTGIISQPKCNTFNIERLLFKLVGWVVTIGLISSPYWIFPEYLTSFYIPFFNALSLTWSYITGFFLICIIWDDLCSSCPQDDYYQIGRNLILCNWPDILKVNLKQHFLGWLVKIYFLPLMFVYLVNYTGMQLNFSARVAAYDSLYTLIFFTDTAFVCVGYLFANKLIDTHIRSTEPTTLGWVIALICYQPFWGIIGSCYLAYGHNWGSWLREPSILQIMWMGGIILCWFLYIWATIAFGSRFSNLTHRGILVCGPYAYMKHPAYIGKLASFFLMYIPFIGNTWLEIIRGCLLWGGVCGIYYIRAKTEERHLRLAGPGYDMYCTEVKQNQKRLAGKIQSFFLAGGQHV